MDWLLAALCGLLAVLHGLRLVATRVPAEAGHGAMALGMAAMFAPHDPVPGWVWLGLFAVCTVGAAAAVARSRDAGGEPGHLLVGGLAMLFMTAVGHPAPGWAAPAAFVLAGACAWHAVRCVQRLDVAGRGTLLGPRVGAGAHAAMAAGMGAMLLAAI